MAAVKIRPPRDPQQGSGYFHYGIVLDNDQEYQIDHMEVNGGGFRCDSLFCGAAVFARGDNANASTGELLNSDINLQCTGNAVMNRSGNGMKVANSVIQGYSQFGVRYTAGLQNLFLDANYFEVGNCTNPYYPVSVKAQAGLIGLGQDIFIRGGAQSSAPAGNIPLFASTGTNERDYWIVENVAGYGQGPILLAGYANVGASGSVTIYWPDSTSRNLGAVTYDILLTTGFFAGGGNGSMPYLGNAKYLALGTSTCSKGFCSYTDTYPNSGSNYSYIGNNPQFGKGIWFWPGGTVNATSQGLAGSGGPAAAIHSDKLPSGYVTIFPYSSTIFAQDCNDNTYLYSPSERNCVTTASNVQDVSAMLLSEGQYNPAVNSK